MGHKKGQKKAPKRRKDLGTCYYHQCRKRTEVHKCKYCGKSFCKEHVAARRAGMPNFRSVTEENRIFMKEWHKTGGHGCIEYFNVWVANNEAEALRYKEALDRCLAKGLIEHTEEVQSIEDLLDQLPGLPDKEEKDEDEPIKKPPKPGTTKKVRKVIKMVLCVLFLGFVILYGLGYLPLNFGESSPTYKLVTITGYDHGECVTPNVYVWSEPGPTSSVIDTIQGCPTHEVKSSNETMVNEEHFYYIITDDKEGWVLSDYVADSNKTIDQAIYTPNLFEEPLKCADGTEYGGCSLTKPKYCEEGTLVNKASMCGCPYGEIQKEEICISKYMTEPKTVTLYAGSARIDYEVYKGVNDYLAGLGRSIYYSYTVPTDRDFIIKQLDNSEQSRQLDPLVEQIKQLSPDKNVQARYAIRFVQNIPYDWDAFRSGDITGKYPYEVLYDMSGVCSEKTLLMVYLLRGLGFETAVLRFNVENHDVVGIKCSSKDDYKDTGFCFVEATAPTPIGYSYGYYVGVGQLTSTPNVISISNGDSFSFEIAPTPTKEEVTPKEPEINRVSEPDVNVKTIYTGLMEVMLSSEDKDADIGYAIIKLEGFYSSGVNQYDQIKISVEQGGIKGVGYFAEGETKRINAIKITVKSILLDSTGGGEVTLEVTT